MKRIGAAIVVALVIGWQPIARADAPPPKLDDAIAMAKREGKPLLVQLSASWCGPCHLFEKTVLTRPEVRAALSGWVFVIYDCERGTGIEAAERLQPGGYPTFVVLDENGKERRRSSGASPAPAFMRFLDSAYAEAMSTDTLAKRLEASPDDPKLLLQSARQARSQAKIDEALSLYDRAAQSDGDESARADAVWEAAGIRRIQDRANRVIEDSLSFVRAFPRSTHAARPLEILALFKILGKDELAPLLDAQIDAHADDALALRRLALLARTMGEPDRARRAGTRLRELAPDDPDAKALAEGKTTIQLDVDEDGMIYAANRALDGVEGHLYEADYGFDLPSPRPRDPWFENIRSTGRARYVAFARAAARCGASARGVSEVWVRVTVPAEGGQPSDVTVLDSDVPWNLSRCLEVTLAATKFPTPRDGRELRLTEPILFDELPGTASRSSRSSSRGKTRLRLLGFAGLASGADLTLVTGLGTVSVLRGPLTASLTAYGGATDGGDGLFGAELLVGAGVRKDFAFIGLRSGVTYDRLGDLVPAGAGLPIELFLSIDGRAEGWLRVGIAWNDERQAGTESRVVDETSIGVLVRVWTPVWLGLSLRETMDEKFVGLSVGIGHER